MKKLWQDFKRDWKLSSPGLRFFFVLVFAVTIAMAVDLAKVIVQVHNEFAAMDESANVAETEPTEEPSEEPEEFRLPAADFTSTRLTLKYQKGDWDGTLIRSTDGEHVASVDKKGELWIDGSDKDVYVDLPLDMHTDGVMAIYHDENGTYFSDYDWGRRADHTDFFHFCRGVEEPQYGIDASSLDNITALVYDEFILEDGAVIFADNTSSTVARFNPGGGEYEMGELEVLIKNASIASPVKIAGDKVRFAVKVNFDDDTYGYQMCEVGATGEAKKIGDSARHFMRLRAENDYPDEGNMAEFWLVRKAYQTGVYDGLSTTMQEIADKMKVELKATEEQVVHDRRNPNLKELNFGNINPESIVKIRHERIIIDNVEKYYLHATVPYLADDIEYRKIEDLGWRGFVEIDDLHVRNYWSSTNMPVSETPSCRISYAVRAEDFTDNATIDLTTASISLPYFDYVAWHTDGLEYPEDFLKNLEIIDAENLDNGMRAVAIGYYNTSDRDDPEANYTLYLSRKNSGFVALTYNTVETFFWGEYSSAHLNGNYDAPFYDQLGLIIYGRERYGHLSNIFAFDDELELFTYYSTD